MKKPKLGRSALLAVSLAGSLLTVIAVLALVTVLRAEKPAKGGGGEDTPYPYSWEEKRSGTLSVALSAPPEGYAWRVDMGEDSESVTAEQTKPGAFTVSPLRENPAALTFTLAAAEDADDALAELEFGVYVETRGERLKATHSGDRLTVLPGMLRGGEELGCPYKLWSEGGSLIAFLADDAQEPDWDVRIGDRSVASPGAQERADGGWRVTFHPAGEGTTTLALLGGARSLRLSVAVACDGESLRVTSHELTRLADGALFAAAEMAAPGLKAPQGAQDVEYGALDLGTSAAAAVSFTTEGWSWSLFAADDMDLSERFAGDYDDAGVLYFPIDEVEVAVASAPRGAYLWWTDDGGRAYLLVGLSDAEAAEQSADEPDYDALLGMAQQVMTAQ